MLKKQTISLIFYFLCIHFSSLLAQADSTILTYETFLKDLIRFHPIAQQADLKLQFAAAERLAAKGNFDPTIKSTWAEKNFDEKLYYRQSYSKLTVPTPLGIDVVGGYEYAKGDFLNPENKLDEYGLWNIGLEVNVLQGLWINERRTALQQAAIFQKMAINQQEILLNELIYKASIAYLDWQKYYFFQQIFIENQDLAATYFENTKQSFLGGEKTAMDTLEAFIMRQDAIILLQGNEAKLSKSRQSLEVFLWYEKQPIALQNTTRPETYQVAIFQPNIATTNAANLAENHPIIQEKKNKQAYLELEQRLKREKYKPKLKAKYNPLLTTSENSIAPIYSAVDYKWGFDFSMPLFLRSERADVQKTRIKIEDLNLDIQNKQYELQNKLENSLQQQAILQEQLAFQTRSVTGYRRLLEGEREKFRYGESSVFLLNKRQEKYIDGELKQIDLQAKLLKEQLSWLYYANELQ